MYSALKRGGQPLYRLARAGVTVERAARADRGERAAPARARRRRASSSRRCAPRARTCGCWPRTSPPRSARSGTCTALRRLYVEPFAGRAHARPRGARGRRRAAGRWPALLPRGLAARTAAGGAPRRAAQTRRLLHGQDSRALRTRPLAAAPPGARVRLYDAVGRFLGIGEAARQRRGAPAPAPQWHRARLRPTGRAP